MGGTLVAVGSSVAVGSDVAVGGTGVSVGTAVSVAAGSVAVAGISVAVGATVAGCGATGAALQAPSRRAKSSSAAIAEMVGENLDTGTLQWTPFLLIIKYSN